MAAGFTILDHGCVDTAVLTSQNTGSITPAIGDIVFFGGDASVGTGAALSGGGMTWDRLHLEAATDEWGAVFRATSGTPSAGALTLSITDNTRDCTWVIVRPVDLTYVGIAGSNNSVATQVASLTVSLTTSSPAALLAWFRSDGVFTWAQDSGWTETLDESVASGGSQQLQERFSDDTEVIGDASSNARMLGICLEFAAAGGGGATQPPRSMHQYRQRRAA